MIVSIDQMGRTIELHQFPKRIVSLVPSQTELLFDLGLNDSVVGITKFCIHPTEWHKAKPKVGGTKKINFEILDALNPDLIIGNKEENSEGQIKSLMEKYPVWMSDIHNLEDALDMIRRIGILTNTESIASSLNEKITFEFSNLDTLEKQRKPTTVGYLIWKNPLMAAGGDTFINDMLEKCQLKNIFSDKRRYPEISPDFLKASKPELILLSSEPFPFREKHLSEFKSISPSSKVLLVDGESFSWYGSRLLKSPQYFQKILKVIDSAL